MIVIEDVDGDGDLNVAERGRIWPSVQGQVAVAVRVYVDVHAFVRDNGFARGGPLD